MSRALVSAFISFGFMTGYLGTTLLKIPVTWYYPLERRYALELRPTGLAMDFYGRLFASVVCAAVFGVVGRAVERWIPADRRPRWLAIVTAWAVSFFVLLIGLYVERLMTRPPAPVPLPPGYLPR
jgi:small-conductance mechanosensitive channel